MQIFEVSLFFKLRTQYNRKQLNQFIFYPFDARKLAGGKKAFVRDDLNCVSEKSEAATDVTPLLIYTCFVLKVTTCLSSQAPVLPKTAPGLSPLSLTALAPPVT